MAALVYAAIGLTVMATGPQWIERLMPPLVTGTIGCAIGLNLAPSAVQGLAGGTTSVLSGGATAITLMILTIAAPAKIRRVSLLIAVLVGYVIYVICTSVFGAGKPVDFQSILQASLLGWPSFSLPRFDRHATALIAPIAIVLVAENLGHLKALGILIGQPLDKFFGRTFVADAAATLLAASGGGTGVTTYVENIGVMAMSGVFSTAVFIMAGVFAIFLGFSPMFGAFVMSIPAPVLGGLAVVVIGLIIASMIRLWIDNSIDFPIQPTCLQWVSH